MRRALVLSLDKARELSSAIAERNAVMVEFAGEIDKLSREIARLKAGL